jgi:anaerobic selenocysteine-containing dehydrogenase
VAKLQRPDLAPPGTRALNILDMGRYLAEDDIDPPLRAVFIYNHNPIVVHPDQNRMRRGLARDDVFTIGLDVTMTESMAYCDIVLPGATQFEYADLYASYGHHWLQRAEPVIPPLGESLSNTEVFRRLATRFGFNDPCFGASDEALMDDAIDLGETRPSTIPLERATQMQAGNGEPLVLFENVFPATPSGRIELRSETLATRWGKEALLPAWREPQGLHPLMLISPASDKRITSTFGFGNSTPRLLMHPRDAAARSLSPNAEVKVWNERGEVILPLEITDGVPAGVVASEKGAWLATSRNGQTISALVSADRRADLAEGACFNDTLEPDAFRFVRSLNS